MLPSGNKVNKLRYAWFIQAPPGCDGVRVKLDDADLCSRVLQQSSGDTRTLRPALHHGAMLTSAVC